MTSLAEKADPALGLPAALAPASLELFVRAGFVFGDEAGDVFDAAVETLGGMRPC